MSPAIRVLLIEDDEDDYLLTTELLEDIATAVYDIRWVDSAEEGITELNSASFDVCLLDFRLGASTGIDVLEQMDIRRDQTPCILLTGQSDTATDHAAAIAGAADYLVKGKFGAEDLERAIRYACETAHTMKALHNSRERFRSVIEATHEGIVLFEESGLLVTANQAAHRMFGAEPGTLIGTSFSALLSDSDISALLGRLDISERAGSKRTTAIEASGLRADGSAFPLEFSIAPVREDGRSFFAAVIRDNTVHRDLIQQLTHQSFHDPLTGLANRALLQERISQASRRGDDGDLLPALLLLDIDEFKRINDVHGMTAGDGLLRAIGGRLGEYIRGGDTIARIGANEFALFLEELDDGFALMRFSERIRAALAEGFIVEGQPISVSASIGIAMLGTGELEPEELLRNAGVALYLAKANGKNRVELFDEDVYGSILEEITLEDELSAAVAADEIEVHYQPIVGLETGEIVAVEALARWSHAQHGPISPVVFIAIAEKSDLIDALGKAVLKKAVHDAVRMGFGTEHDLYLSVNVSTHQLEDPGFVAFTTTLLAEAGLDPSRLCIEVTESVMLGNAAGAIKKLAELRTLGITVALDDFGTGYSSLSYLSRLPADILKLDRAFVTASGTRRGRRLVEVVASLSTAFDLSSVAEGIETEAERDLLLKLGFRLGQGYLFSRPVPPAELVEYIALDAIGGHGFRSGIRAS